MSLARRQQRLGLDVLRANAHADQARRQAPQIGAAVKPPHRQRRGRRSTAGKHAAEKVILDLHLQPLRDPRRQQAPFLDGLQIAQREPTSRKGSAKRLEAATAS